MDNNNWMNSMENNEGFINGNMPQDPNNKATQYNGDNYGYGSVQGINNDYNNMNSGYNNGNVNTGYNNNNGYCNTNMGYSNNQMQGMNNGYNNIQTQNMSMGYQNSQQNTGIVNVGVNYGSNEMTTTGNRGMTQQIDAEIFTEIDEYKRRLRGMREVQALTGEVEVQNPNSIIVFGQRASENISKISDELLNSMKAVKAEEASEMLINLTKIMDKFDLKEIEDTRPESVVTKFFKNVGTTVAKLFQKYDTMGYEVEKIYVLLKKYENDIRESNAKLKKLYDGNLEFYQLLEKYIVAGEMALEEIDVYINQIGMDYSLNNEEKQMMLQKLEICKDMLSQRIYDLKIAENVAIQAAPMIQTIQMSNFNLMRKINSSFIVTLPIFKQCLAQAIILKRQEIQAKSIKQLDDKTNELIMRNAASTARQSVEIAKMATGSSVAIQTLEKSYETIMKGIEDTKAIQEQNRVQRNENSMKLESLKIRMKKNIAHS